MIMFLSLFLCHPVQSWLDSEEEPDVVCTGWPTQSDGVAHDRDTAATGGQVTRLRTW